jgi:hypothetical protein
MRKKKFLKYFSVFMALNILFEVISPTVSLALTNSSVQPEFTNFEPANSSEMVDLFTGDFKYNIPLMDVEGYPLNLAYHAGSGMESEASWVGLGWSLNPGVLNRMVRGLPDDFDGDVMKSETHIKPHAAMGVGYQYARFLAVNTPSDHKEGMGAGANLGIDAGVAVTYNNYKGYGVELQLDGHASLSGHVGHASGGVAGGVGMTMSSQDGGTLSYQHSRTFGLWGYSNTIGEGTSINTRSGAMTNTYFGSHSVKKESVTLSLSTSHSIPAGPVAYSPGIGKNYTGFGFGLNIKGGLWGCVSLEEFGIPLEVTAGLMTGYKGFYNKMQIDKNQQNLPGYGYMYLEQADENSVMDFNRTREGVLVKETPNINMANLTYDIYSASAQGMGSNFRPFRSDVGVVHDNTNYQNSGNTSAGFELGIGGFTRLLIDFMYVSSNARSGLWHTMLSDNLNFASDTSAYYDYEKIYFKQMGELVSRSGDINIGGEDPISPVLTPSTGLGLEASSGLAGATGTILTRSAREKRVNDIITLTGEQADIYGFGQNYFYAQNGFTVVPNTRAVLSQTPAISKTTKSSANDIAKHVSEVCVTKNDGAKYYYGIPVYNLQKKRVMFNASSRKESAYNTQGWPTTSFTTNSLVVSDPYQMVKYSTSDLSTNLRGLDNYYQVDETPQYATSYLLTAIVSPDYVDVTGDGPSYDDLGTYTKFNYSKDSDHNWREPYVIPSSASEYTSALGTASLEANMDWGLLSDRLDDKGYYEYGQREIFYLHSIETKNYVATFSVSTRSDLKGISDEHGGIPTSSTAKKLDKIELYSKSELINKQLNGGTPTPIKTVNFVYDAGYPLCPGTFNSSAGKLTLSKVYFTFGSSQKSALSPYEFYYADNDHNTVMDANFTYHPRAVDRWGSYMPNTNVVCGTTTSLNNTEAPYSVQTKSLADSYAAAWNLTDIVTPSGSSITVTYESDDYGYIQDEQAGQMLKINNIVSSVNTSSSVSAYSSNTDIRNTTYMIVDMQTLRSGIPTSVSFNKASDLVKKMIFNENKKLYYRCFTKVGAPENSWGINDTYYDFLPGYAETEDAGVFDYSPSGNTYTDQNNNTCYRYAYVKLVPDIAYGSQEVNPICLAGWQFIRTYLPRVAYPGSEPDNMGDGSHKPLKELKNMLIGLGVAFEDFIAGIANEPNYRFYHKKYCKQIVYEKSFVRAYVPYRNKLGGGHRVKQIVSYDLWNSVTSNLGGSESLSTYGQTYDYTTTDPLDGSTISSGVASYEPLVGGEENSMHQPYPFTLQKKWAPNDHFYQEAPLGELFYPSPLVGYSKVTVRNIDHDYGGGVTAPQTGKTTYEFFTAKDFPVQEQRTELTTVPFQNPIIEAYTVVNPAYTVFHAVQGHTLKFNDMHGKLKSILTYGEDNYNAPISGTNFFYRQNGPKLKTSAPALNVDGSATSVVSRDLDITVDARENLDESVTLGNQFLLELSMCSESVDNTQIYSDQIFGIRMASNTKIVQQYGILDRTESFDNKTRSVTSNILWDGNTGDIVLSSSTNELDQRNYSMNYPAYWAYPNLGNESRRIGVVTEVTTSASPSLNPVWNVVTGVISKSATACHVEAGDEVYVYDQGHNQIGANRYWVVERSDMPSPSGGYDYWLLDAGGRALNQGYVGGLNSSTKYYFKVLRPAQHNQMELSAGHVATVKTQPAVTMTAQSSGYNVISASAIEYCQYWQSYEYNASVQSYSSSPQTAFPAFPTALNYTASPNYAFNPYTAGCMGRWMPWRDYVYNVPRTYSTQPNIKNDGVYAGFTPFWNVSTGSWTLNSSATDFGRWITNNESTVFSPEGFMLESKDAIGVYHSQRMGYNQMMPIISASNAKLSEIAFEGFEEYPTIYPSYTLHPASISYNDHTGFYPQLNTAPTTPCTQSTTAHTGRYSLSLSNGDQLTFTCSINKEDVIAANSHPAIIQNNILVPFNRCGSEHNSLYPDIQGSKKYMTSFWVKASAASTYTNALTTTITVAAGGTTVGLTPSIIASPVINGWQKIDYAFTLPSVSVSPSNVFTFKITASSAMSLDDFRFQPYNASATCTVYDPYHLRPWAILDDRNYATLIEYDNQGIAVRKKKETEKGIYTISESRSSTVKR